MGLYSLKNKSIEPTGLVSFLDQTSRKPHSTILQERLNSSWKEISLFSPPLNKLAKRNVLSGLVTQACNPTYLGGRNWEDCGLRPARAKICL
jgi:hypothetical protein